MAGDVDVLEVRGEDVLGGVDERAAVRADVGPEDVLVHCLFAACCTSVVATHPISHALGLRLGNLTRRGRTALTDEPSSEAGAPRGVALQNFSTHNREDDLFGCCYVMIAEFWADGRGGDWWSRAVVVVGVQACKRKVQAANAN